MALNLVNLEDEGVRIAMLNEFYDDHSPGKGGGYQSSFLSTSANIIQYFYCLREALEKYNENWLANNIKYLLKEGAKIDSNITLAEDQFNWYYIRGLCRVILSENVELVMIYRAKKVKDPRPESILLENTPIRAQLLLDTLRETRLEPHRNKTGVPGGPNSGLSIKRM